MDWIRSKIRSIRSAKKLSQEKMAELLGIEQTTYSNWETGKIDITLKNLERISIALGVPVEEFWDASAWISRPAKKSYEAADVNIQGVNEESNTYLTSTKTSVPELQKEIMMLKEQNLALTRAYNELFEKKRESKSIIV